MVNPLARVVMKNIVNNTDHSRLYIEEKKVANITNRDEELLKNIIKKDIQVKNSGGKANMITLDEAVERIKDGL